MLVGLPVLVLVGVNLPLRIHGEIVGLADHLHTVADAETRTSVSPFMLARRTDIFWSLEPRRSGDVDGNGR